MVEWDMDFDEDCWFEAFTFQRNGFSILPADMWLHLGVRCWSCESFALMALKSCDNDQTGLRFDHHRNKLISDGTSVERAAFAGLWPISPPRSSALLMSQQKYVYAGFEGRVLVAVAGNHANRAAASSVCFFLVMLVCFCGSGYNCSIAVT